MPRKRKAPAESAPRPDLDYIAEPLRPLAVEIGSLKLDPMNARKHDEANIRAIMGSLRTFGQVKSLVVNRDTREVEAGNGTVIAAQQLGWTHLAVVLVAHDPAAHRGFAIADNRTAELARWDDTMLQALLSEIEQDIPDLYEDLLLARLHAESEPEPTSAARQLEGDESWGVLVKCSNETQQKILLERLEAEGYEVRAMIV